MRKETAGKAPITAEKLARKQRDISVSEFFLKNRHLLGFDNPRKALLTTVKEAVDNALDACEEAQLLPTISVDIEELAPQRFRVTVTDNGPGIVRRQVPRIFAKLLYGSKFHRLRMARGQQGIGISAAGMYGQLTTGTPTRIRSRTRGGGPAHLIEVLIDTRRNKPSILRDEEVDWRPEFFPTSADGKPGKPRRAAHGTSVEIELEAAYTRGRLSVDEYVKQCAIVNPHLELHLRIRLLKDRPDTEPDGEPAALPWTTYHRAVKKLPAEPREIRPHPHGVELGLLMQMLKDSKSRTLRAMLQQDFSRISSRTALGICERAGLNPRANPTRIAHRESESLFTALNDTKLMRPPLDCLSPIGEAEILSGLQKEIAADFYTAVSRPPAVYRGNPFLIEAGLAYARPGDNAELTADSPARLCRFANRVPLLYMAGGCAITKAATAVNWRSYGLTQPRGALPVGPLIILVHIASVWVPFTSESKEAVAHYPEIVRDITFALQECGRRLSVHLSRRRRQAEAERKREYMALYLPHLAHGIKDVLELSAREETRVVRNLERMLEKTRLKT